MTPLIRQYDQIKKEHPSQLLLFQLGDFYEFFFEDAKVASKTLLLTLTQRQGIPMCGVPVRAMEKYVDQLVKAGHSVAICDQVSQPNKDVKLVERKVTEVLTPGAITNGIFLNPSEYNYLGLLLQKRGRFLFSWADISTTTIHAQIFPQNYSLHDIQAELSKIEPRELILDESLYEWFSSQNTSYTLHNADSWLFESPMAFEEICEQFSVSSLKGYGLEKEDPRILVIAGFFRYIRRLALGSCSHIQQLELHDNEQSRLRIDKKTLEELQVIDAHTDISLYKLLNKCHTPMGMRFLKESLSQPLADQEEIEIRQAHVTNFFSNSEIRKQCSEYLKQVKDIQRITARCSVGKGSQHLLIMLLHSLKYALDICTLLVMHPWNFQEILDTEAIHRLFQMLYRALEPSNESSRNIRPHFNKELDSLYTLKQEHQQLLDIYIQDISKNNELGGAVKLGYNRVLGHFIEIRQSKTSAIPQEFILRQQLKEVFRYTTRHLQELETKKILTEEKIEQLEAIVLAELLQEVIARTADITSLSHEIAYVDFIQALATVAEQQNFVCPTLHTGASLEIVNGRHPLLETHLHHTAFVPNDLLLTEDSNLHIITGPNMAGKSTFLRQNALIILLAHIGSYVPATRADIPLRDALFCRMGAADNITRGESTFLLEMLETAYILRHISPKSFVVFDEIGRGTSSLDGFAIAWAIVQYILETSNTFCLFATHFHDFAALQHNNVRFFSLQAFRNGGELEFLRKISQGIIPHSFGIEVARMAGLPKKVLTYAQKKLDILLANQNTPTSADKFEKTISQKEIITELQQKQNENNQLDVKKQKLFDDLASIEPNAMSPLDALEYVIHLKNSYLE